MQPAVILAPMAGFTDRTFRALCASFGCDLSYTEMVSAKGLYYTDSKTNDLLRLGLNERHVGLQLFGSDPVILSKIVRHLCDTVGNDFDCIDFNMGCPARKITSNGEGSALMREPLLVSNILSAMVKSSTLPISVKMRKGWDEEHVNCVDLARICQDCGISSIAIHGRTRDQLYGGYADLDCISAVKSAVSIPVIGNGDIRSAKDALNMLSYTHCDGVMVARGALGNPWIFSEIKAALCGTHYTPPTEQERMELACQHAKRVIADKGEHGIIELRKHMPFYLQGIRNAAALRQRVTAVESLSDLQRLLLDRHDPKTYNK